MKKQNRNNLIGLGIVILILFILVQFNTLKPLSINVSLNQGPCDNFIYGNIFLDDGKVAERYSSFCKPSQEDRILCEPILISFSVDTPKPVESWEIRHNSLIGECIILQSDSKSISIDCGNKWCTSSSLGSTSINVIAHYDYTPQNNCPVEFGDIFCTSDTKYKKCILSSSTFNYESSSTRFCPSESKCVGKECISEQSQEPIILPQIIPEVLEKDNKLLIFGLILLIGVVLFYLIKTKRIKV